jgi:hypothetical protein
MPSEAEFKELVDEANGGDKKAIQKLRSVLRSNPEIWKGIGDNLAAHARHSIIKLIANGNQLVAESLKLKAEDLERELTRNKASPLEKMAVNRVVSVWLEAQFSDALGTVTNGKDLARARFELKQRDASDKRLSTAMKSLATLQKLLGDE